MIRLRKSYFTLLEILTVMLIIGIAAGVVGFQIKAIYQEQRFLSEVSQIVSHLRTAQDLMILKEADIHFKLRHNNEYGLLEYWLQSDTPIKGLFAAEEEKLNKQYLHGIRSFTFKPTNNENKDELDLLFTLGRADSGKLVLSPDVKDKYDRDEHSNDYEIVLHPYPHPIESRPYSETIADEVNEKEESQRLYPEEDPTSPFK